MRTDELDYELPENQIAQYPSERRDASRLLILDRAAGSIREDVFRQLPEYLHTGDCLVFNNTRVIRARLHAHKETGGRVEIFLLQETAPAQWEALVRPSARVKPGSTVQLAGGLTATVGAVLDGGRRQVRFPRPDVLQLLEEIGEIPLPPYIHREHEAPVDAERYQTIYAAQPGAVAAPTAGLHYTPEVFEALDTRAINRAQLTLHVGYGTFRPITADTLDAHQVEAEDFEFPAATAEQLNATRTAGGRIVAVGTTVTRVLETQCKDGRFFPGNGTTDTYIHPPYTWRAVDVLQTNFHLPRSSLLALVCAFAGTDFTLEAYQYAVRAGFRFYSYGDAMLIL